MLETSISLLFFLPVSDWWTINEGEALKPQSFWRRYIMGRYVLAWLLGVPLSLLVIIYLIFN
jgi:hypothetical protein